MIKIIKIQNFKSIKHIQLDCKRINVLIGEPNTGKSNILESLGVFSYGGYNQYGNLRNFVRFERSSNLFYDENLDESVRISLDDINFGLSFKDGSFDGKFYLSPTKERVDTSVRGDYQNLAFAGGRTDILSPFKFYKFAIQNEFPRPESGFLLPPSGRNLMSLIQAHKELRFLVNDMFGHFGFELYLRPQENNIELLKRLEGITVSYPYSLVSDTLQRTIFHLYAILSNRDSILVFEEPESHAFPYYTKYLAETISLDEKNNQYFISTHNPYLLLPILEKAPKEDIAVFITYFKDYQTGVKPLSAEEMEEIMEIDVFSNLDRFLGGR